MPKGYQCFKTREREVYCSSYQVRNHTEGAEWVSATMEHFGIEASQLLGRPYLSHSQPSGAIIYPTVNEVIQEVDEVDLS